MVLLVADMKELKANPNKQAKGAVIEAKLDKSRGPVATMLVQRGTLDTGDTIVVGSVIGRIRAMYNDKGKKVKIYTSFPDSNEWKDKVFEGTVEQAGRDHIVLRDTKDGRWYLILMIYLDYVEFEEKINYNYPNIFD